MIKKHHLTALVLAGAFLASQANADCAYPAKPGKMPDGTTATKDEMVAAKKLVVQYNTDMATYLNCLDTEFSATLAAMPAETDKAKVEKQTKQKAEMQKKQDEKHDAAVNELTSVTDGFNEQLRAYKAKNATPEKKTS
jgi:type IV secretory pathway VirB4 component